MTSGREVCALVDIDAIERAVGFEIEQEPTPHEESRSIRNMDRTPVEDPGRGAGCVYRGAGSSGTVVLELYPSAISLGHDRDPDDIVFAGGPEITEVPGLGEAVLGQTPHGDPPPGGEMSPAGADVTFIRQDHTLQVTVIAGAMPQTSEAIEVAKAVAETVG